MNYKWLSSTAISKRGLPFLLLLVVLSRLFAAVVIWKINGASVFLTLDSPGYVYLATSLVHGSFGTGNPEIFRTPGYPLLLLPAVLFQHYIIVALLENVLFCAVSAWLIYRITTMLAPESPAAFWAVLLYCFEPIGFLEAEKILSETAFTTLFLVFFWLFVRFLRRPAYARLLLAALALGCAAYVRPVPIYLGLWLVPVLAIFPRATPWTQRAARAILFPIVVGLTLTPWMARNAMVAGYHGFSSTSDWNMYFLGAAAVRAKLEHRTLAEVEEEMGGNDGPDRAAYFQQHPEQRTWSNAQIEQFWGTEWKRIIAPHWLMYSVIHAKGCAIVMLNPGISEVLRDFGLYPLSSGELSNRMDRGIVGAGFWLLRQYPITAFFIPLMMAQLLVYYALAMAGLRRMPEGTGIVTVAMFLYFVLASGFPAAVSRYRAPVMPLVCICAGIAVANWSGNKHRQQHRLVRDEARVVLS